MQPRLLDCSHAKTLISILNSTVHTGLSIILDTQGSPNIHAGTGNKVEVVDTAL